MGRFYQYTVKISDFFVIQKDTLKDAFKRRWYKNPKTLVSGTWSPALTCIFKSAPPPGAVHLPPRKRTNTKCEWGRGTGGVVKSVTPFYRHTKRPSRARGQNKTREGVKQPLLSVSWVPTVKGSRRLHQPSGYVCITGFRGTDLWFLISPLLKLNFSFIKRILS